WADNLRLVGEHKRHYYALLWYAALNATQRATLQRGLPISYSAMTPPQRALFETAIHANDFICAQPTPIDPENARALFTLDQGEQEVHMALDKQIKRMNRRSYQLQFYRVQNSSDLFEFGYYLPSE
ncbi:MAG: hypothetical protein NZM28_03030, partial [Fimbriimonadales bacterium]|nr:hypothetical protein [Fimbriimonadales bacterium]